MTQASSIPQIETKNAQDLYPLLHEVPAFAEISAEDLSCLGDVRVFHAEKGSDIFALPDTKSAFWVLLEGKIRLTKPEADNRITPLGTVSKGDTFGETPLLIGKASHVVSEVLEPSTLIQISEHSFWALMFACPTVRAAVLGNMARRLQEYQSQALHREKLVSLGTLAAGLMHELNNPGAAARRAASQLRENLSRVQQLSLRYCSREQLSPEQTDCMLQLQKQALAFHKPRPMSSLEQSDAEEALAQWLEEQGVENAWQLSPTLTSIGFDAESLECARAVFPGDLLSDSLNWLEALTSSVQLVGTVEESVSRVTELVRAVKKYAYEDKAQRHQIDIHDSIESTLVILAHKFRQKELTIEKEFARDLPPLTVCGTGLNQVWTNLLDNAIDAAPQKGTIRIRTSVDQSRICIAIADNGPGIAPENLKLIFEPFFTTKPMGVGTGLGLDIVHRIVVGQFGGQVKVSSEPGRTEFTVVLPSTC